MSHSQDRAHQVQQSDHNDEIDLQAEIRREQEYVDGLFQRLDNTVTQATERLRKVQAEVEPGNAEDDALILRETEYHGLNEKLDRLNLAQLGLVFGRIDIAADPADNENPIPGRPDVERRYIGRMGIDDREDNYRTLLIDWRAPMARPFYLATTAQPEGVEIRRHIRTRGRTVTSIDDEVLSGEAAAITRQGVGSETALYQAMKAARTGHMRSIVETIQREQDEIIRDPSRGVMVVQGGPGTGKTAVALHRVAYVLYTHQELLARTGVLIIGPNPTFLEYISRVLPELGETGVVLSTLGDLFPGVSGHAPESLLTREVKGSEAMVDILREWVRAHQRVPESTLDVCIGSIPLSIDPEMVAKARTRARRSRKPHNEAQAVFAEHLIGQLAGQMAHTIGADPLGGKNLLSAADVDQLHDDLAEEPAIMELIDALWPELTPITALRELLEDAENIAIAASEYDEDTQAALFREPGSPWASSDAALLDELAVLIGLDSLAEESGGSAEPTWRKHLAEAEVALDALRSSASTDTDDEFEAEILSAHDVVDAETLAKRQQVRDLRTTAERAAADRTWSYGHVVVDEAQELTPMEWRMVFRRSPNRWITIVGDIAQNSAPAGVDSWEESLEPFVGSRLNRRELSINYRTPSEIMEYANEILWEIDPQAQPAVAIRSSGQPVRYFPAGTDPVSVIPEGSGLSHIITAENVAEVKGLEFDHVVVVDPQRIVEASPQGWQDLYVAVTRATQTLTIIGDAP